MDGASKLPFWVRRKVINHPYHTNLPTYLCTYIYGEIVVVCFLRLAVWLTCFSLSIFLSAPFYHHSYDPYDSYNSLDTGCDLRAAGLQVTSEGLPKYLDCLDCTGGGTVEMSPWDGVFVDGKTSVPSQDTTATTTTTANNTTTTITTTTSTANTSSSTTVVIRGISGRNLTLGPWWYTEEGGVVPQLRLGAIPLYRLVPNSVQQRLERERKEKFRRHHAVLMTRTQQALDETVVKQQQQQQLANTNNQTTTKVMTMKQQQKDLTVLLEQYQNILDNYQDAGPLLDVILLESSNGTYKAVVDVDGTGNLTHAIPLAPFGTSRQGGELGFGSAVTFCVQIYDHGKTLSIVTDAGSHGTHVAGIAAAYFLEEKDATNRTSSTTTTTNKVTHRSSSDESNKTQQERWDRNGVAPGAQILACKIGDGRLGSAETGKGLIRALIAAKKYGCDLINLSYGEPYWQSDSGRVAQTFSDAVHKWGMTVFTSAGNDGPALSSLGSPGTLSSLITVGAFVSPDMMVEQYSTLPPTDDDAPPLRDSSYHFSSRGPTPDGRLPDLCAPGGAIAPIPRHALQGKAQYHGTSMSSPNACGVAACVLSALKQRGLQHISPTELRRGLVNSAKPVDIPDFFAQGSGLISATRAFDYILKHHGKPGQNVTMDVRIPSRNNARGIYIRDTLELLGPLTFNVNVKPRFDHAIERSAEEVEELLSLELDLQLVPSQPWVTCPERMTLFSAQERGGQTFSIRLSGIQELDAGAHYATVDAIDTHDPSRGPVFQVPISVIVPHSNALIQPKTVTSKEVDEANSLRDNGIDFAMTFKLIPGAPNRRFISVPPLAEWATIKVQSLSPDATETSPQRILMHAIPFVRGDLPNRHIQLKKLMLLTERVEKQFHMKLRGGSTLELCLQLLWLANPAPADVVVDVEFHSLNARAQTLMSSQPLVIPPAQGFARFGVSADLRSESFRPKARLNSVRRTISPTSYSITAGSAEQDTLIQSDADAKQMLNGTTAAESLIYDLNLEYNFKIEAEADVKLTPSFPSIFNQLYDSPLDSQVWALKDSNSQVLAFGGAMHQAKAVACTKGDHTLTLYTRHLSRQVLEQIKDIPLQLTFGLSDKTAMNCKIYSQIDKASTPAVTGDGRKEIKSMVLRKGSYQDVYVVRPTGSYPTWTTPGDVLMGTVYLDSEIKDATSMVLSYTIPPLSKVKKANEIVNTKSTPDNDKSLDDYVFESKVDYLSKIRRKDKSRFLELAEELRRENSTHVPLLLEMLQFAREMKDGDWGNRTRVQAIKEACRMFGVDSGGPIDESALAQYFGKAQLVDKDDEEDDVAKELQTKMVEHKKTLQSCLLALSVELSEAITSNLTYVKEFEAAVKHLAQWATSTADLSTDKEKYQLTLVNARRAWYCQGRTGHAISILTKAQNDLPNIFRKDIANELMKIYATIEHASHIVANIQEDLWKRFPPERST